MSSDHAHPDGPVPLSILERVDQKCLQFEAAWLAGQRPRIESFVADTGGVERSKTLRELLLLDLDYRLRNADTPKAAQYERRFPDDGNLIEEVFRKIATETGDVTLVEAESPGVPLADGRGAGDASRYQVLRRHAHGGLGEILIAHDRHLNREVALKELQARHADNANMRARFAREAEITGALEHPGIVPVHSLGSYEDGRLFYTMRFIDGVRLTDSVKDHYENVGRGTPPERSIEFRKLLLRFIDVCHTIDYAHSRGVLHRDLKPENIMLGKYGETIIVDWGLAKAQSDEDEADQIESPKATDLHLAGYDIAETRAGSAIGTPAFMSPEQAAGQRDRIGRCTDVYGLGATLYFILTGTPPFTGGDTATILKRVREGEFPPPCHIRSKTPRPLEAICLRAMAVEPDDRYASAGDLSEDVEAWLADEPTTAYRERFGERSRRFVRRHHTPLWITGVFMLVLFAGLGVGMAVLGAKNRELREINNRETAALERSQQRFELAMEAIECYYTDVSEDVVLREPRLSDLRKRMLSTPLPFYEKLQRDLEGDEDPNSRAALADAYGAVAQIMRQIGDYDRAVESSKREIAIRQWLVKESPEAEYQRDLLDSYNALGAAHVAYGKRTAAATVFRQALESSKQLVAQDPTTADSQSALAQCYNNLSTVSKNVDEACDLLRKAMQIHELLVAQVPDSRLYQSNLARHCGNLGQYLAESGKGEQAQALLARAMQIAEELIKNRPEFPRFREDLSSYKYNAANLERSLGNLPGAIEYMEEALAVDKKLARDYPNVTKYQWSLLKRYNNLGALLSEDLRLDEASDAYDQAIELGTTLVANNPEAADYAIALGGALCNNGNLVYRQGNVEESIEFYTRAIATLEPLLDRDNRTGNARRFLANAHTARARSLHALGKHAESVDDWDRTIQLVPPAQHGKTDHRLVNRARACALSGDHARGPQEAQRLAAGVEPAVQFDLACVLSIAAEAVANDESLASQRRQALADQYADQAIGRLREAGRRGYFDSPDRARQLTTDSDLRHLHNHPGFQQLVAQLEGL